MSVCGEVSPMKHLDRYGVLSENCLAVHVNYLAEGDAKLLGARKATVVHCPRSHAYFGHEDFPLNALMRANVNICLGTDSLATVYKKPRQTVELNMFDELQAFAARHPRVKPETILEMATVNGARALGMAGHAGEISERALADLIVIPFEGKLEEANEAAVHHKGEVRGSMIDGEWAIEPK
jgi:cytosine/adenosine deaminase-related metal-dependent hydrolase